MKKETTISLLKEIRDLLKEQTKIEITGKEIVKNNLIEIIDDGKLKTSDIIAEMKESFDVHCWYSMEQLDKDFPPVKTTRKFKYVQDADEENKNKSANELDMSKQITLRERLLFELEYFKRERKHLDVENITLCAGSRDSDGSVPEVHFNFDYRKVLVGWCHPADSGGILRSRSVVSN